MKFILPILMIPTMAMAAVNKRVALENQYIVKGNKKSLGKNLKKLGKDIFLIQTKEKLTVDNQTVFQNYQYIGEYKEGNSVNDEMLKDQFHHIQIQTEKAWSIEKGSPEIIVAVTDNEFEVDHDDLKNSWWKNPNEIPNNGIDDDGNGYIDDVIGWDTIGNDNNVDVEDGPTHGTHVAGIIAAEINNKIGVAGIAPNVKVMPIRWYGDEAPWTTAVIVESYQYAVNNGAKIINTSYNIDGLVDDAAYLDVIQYVKDQGAIIFNSAGNDRKKDPERQKIEDIVLVCSVKSGKERTMDKKSSFSNYGSGIDICAPGDPILSTVQRRYEGKSRYGELEGTSMASPVAASIAALIWSRNPNFTRQEVLNKLYNSVDNIDDKNRKYKGMLGAGRVNALKAVK